MHAHKRTFAFLKNRFYQIHLLHIGFRFEFSKQEHNKYSIGGDFWLAWLDSAAPSYVTQNKTKDLQKRFNLMATGISVNLHATIKYTRRCKNTFLCAETWCKLIFQADICRHYYITARPLCLYLCFGAHRVRNPLTKGKTVMLMR